MANRAYLYSTQSSVTDSNELWEELDRNDDSMPYYDSRNIIPIAWYFLFAPADLVMVDASYGSSHWEEVKFFANKEKSLTRFSERKPLLREVAASEFYSETAIERFEQNLANREGSCLRLDPLEVVNGGIGDDEECFQIYTQILQRIDNPQATATEVKEVLWNASSFWDQDYWNVHVLGATYW